MTRIRTGGKSIEEDEVLRIAVLAYLKEETAEALEGLARGHIEPSPAFLRRMKRMFHWYEGKLRKGLIYCGQACAAAIGFFALLLLINEDVFQYMEKIYDEYINFETDIHAPEEMELKHHELGYVPDGYVKVMDDLYLSGMIIYENESGNQIVLRYMLNTAGARTDADYSDVRWEKVTLTNQVTAYYGMDVSEKGCRYLLWYRDGNLYELYGTLDYGVLEKIAVNIREK